MVKFRKSFIKCIKNFSLLVIFITVFSLVRTLLILTNYSTINIIKESLEISEAHSCRKQLVPNHPTVSFVLCAADDGQDAGESNHHKLIIRALDNEKDAIFIDLGSGSGRLTLAAAALNHQVIAVDSDYSSVALLRKGTEMSGLTDLIKILFNSISDESGRVEETSSSNNNIISKNAAGTVTLEDILGMLGGRETAVLSIDLQGRDCKAITQYLWRRPRTHALPYIWMRWSNVYNPRTGMNPECDEFPQMLEGFRVAGYSPYTDKSLSVQELMASEHESVMWIHNTADKL